MSETDIVRTGGAAEAVGDTAPRGPLPERCYACGADVLGPYCHQCGQKNDDCRRSIWRLGGEAIRDLTALDGRFLGTVRSVVTRPGRHLRAYGDGRRSPFTPPIRLFLVVTFLFFVTLEASDRQLLVFESEVTADETGLSVEAANLSLFAHPPDAYTPEARAALRQAIIDGLTTSEEEAEATDAVLRDVRKGLTDGDEAAREAGLDLGMAERFDAEAASETPRAGDSGLSWNGETIAPDRVAEALVRAAENPRLLNAVLDDWVGRIMLLMIPLLALLGAMFVRGRDALLYDHLLLSLQTHAVAFGALTVGLWLGGLLPEALAAPLFLLGVPTYWGLALRGAFRRSRRKTIAATLVVWSLYALVAFTALGVAVVLSFLGTL